LKRACEFSLILLVRELYPAQIHAIDSGSGRALSAIFNQFFDGFTLSAYTGLDRTVLQISYKPANT